MKNSTSTNIVSNCGPCIPDGWVWVCLDDVGEWKGGGTPRKSNSLFWTNGTVPWVSPKDMKRFFIDSAEDTITQTAVDDSSAQLLPINSVLLVTRSGILQRTLPVAINTVVVATNQDLKALLPLNGVDTKYIAYLLKAKDYDLRDQCSKDGTTVASIDLPKLKAYSFGLAPAAEQMRIVSAIELLQERSSCARDLLSEVEQLIGQLRQSVLRDAFSGRLTARWREQNPDVQPASELLLRIRTECRQRWETDQLAKYEAKGKKPPKNWRDKYREPEPVDESKLPELPEGWCWAYRRDIGQSNLGKMLDRSKHTTGIELPYLRNINVRWGAIDNKDLLTMFFKENELEKYRVRYGDVLVCEGGEPGRSTVWNRPDEMIMFQKALHRVRLAGGIDPWWLVYHLELDATSESLDQHFTGTTIKHFTGKAFDVYPIALAPLNEQVEILRLVRESIDSLENLANSATSMASSLAQLDQSILAKAFRGELVPQDPNDEPASVLLARIKAARDQAEAEKKSAKQRKTSGKSKRSTRSKTETVQISLESVAFDLLLLLAAWKKPVSIWALESALALMQREDLIGKFKKARSSKRKPKQVSTPILKDMQSVVLGYLVGRKVIKAVGKNGYELIDDSHTKNASAEKRETATAAIAALEYYMNRRELDEQQVRDAIAAQVGTQYEIKTEVPA